MTMFTTDEWQLAAVPVMPRRQEAEMCYYHDGGITNVDYGEEHIMVPRRVDMAHALVRSYVLLGLLR